MALSHAGTNKPFVSRDATTDPRLRQHTDLVATILNSLILKGRLVQVGMSEWDVYGPLPDQPQPADAAGLPSPMVLGTPMPVETFPWQALGAAAAAVGTVTSSGGTPNVHDEPLTDGASNFIFAAGDVVVVVGVPN